MEDNHQDKCWPLFQLLLFTLLALTLAGCAGKPVKAYATNGVPRQVFEWGFWNRSCQASEFTIKVSKGPESGTVEIGTGTMIIGRSSANGVRMACEGESVATKVVNYTANKGFKGTDKFRLSVYSQYSPPNLFDLEVEVR